MGIAVGRIRMSYDEFCRLTPEEFLSICSYHRSAEQEEWERMRLLASITVQPYAKSTIDPKKLIPFPWDKGGEGDKPTTACPKPTREQRLERFKQLINRLDGIQQHHSDNLQA